MIPFCLFFVEIEAETQDF